MNKFIELFKTLLTTGGEHQAFIGAKWLSALLRIAPNPLAKTLALRILALSPHYFYRHVTTEYETLSHREWLDAEFRRNRVTREKICGQVLSPYLNASSRVLDIGCGGGFLAKAVSPHAGKVFACDISSGVLECAEVLNYAPNIIYFLSQESGFQQIENASLDLAYSFAVFQHVREAVMRSLFGIAAQKLRSGGRCLFQVQLDDGKWKAESDWTNDTSLTGRLRLQYALNFFARSQAFFRQLAMDVGLTVDSIRPMSELLDEPFDDIYHQHLIILSKT